MSQTRVYRISPRQERFCQLLKQGVPAFRAYPMAGYQPNNGAPYRMLAENVRVKRRLTEITRHLAMQAKVTVQSITDELNEAAELARRVEQPSAMTQAILAKAKLHGLIIERKEAGAPGDFAAAKTPEEIVAAVRAELGDAAADLVRQMAGEAAQEPADALSATPAAGESIN
jgi:hypothetical protein